MKSSLFITLLLSCSSLAGEWVNISDRVTSQVKPGYAGPTAGIVVDRVSGDVFLVVNDQGLWRSSDRGETFARCDGQAIGGRCETGWALQADPAGKRLACFMIYGSSGLTTDGAATWTKWKTSHLDFGSVDWADTGKRLLALRHESGGMLTTSEDAGVTWQDLGKGFSGCGVLDRAIYVATKEKESGIFRSTDAGKTWIQVSAEKPTAAVPVIFEGAAYWTTGKGILISRDKGESWSTHGTPVDATHGPYFGKDSSEAIVAGKSGFSETRDGGQTWRVIAPLPEGFKVSRIGPNFAWDAKANIIYASTMTKPAFKWKIAD
jgi:photosystem II stability/assembly factor-like uncharacterized protein